MPDFEDYESMYEYDEFDKLEQMLDDEEAVAKLDGEDYDWDAQNDFDDIEIPKELLEAPLPDPPEPEVIPDPIRPETSVDFSSFHNYFDELKTGFIPFEIREGYHGAPEEKLTQDMVHTIREEYNPSFGYTIGLDTTKFYTKAEDGEPQNMTVIHAEYDDIKPILPEWEYQPGDLSDIRIYKQFGDKIDVDGVNVSFANLCTIELHNNKDGRLLRTQLAVDDAGTVRGVVGLGLAGVPISDELTTLSFNHGLILHPDVYTEKVSLSILDRTDVENKGHFRVFEGKDESFREEFLAKMEEKFPEFMDQLSKKVIERIEDRKELVDAHIQYVKEMKDDTSRALNIIELDKESGMAESYREFQDAKTEFWHLFGEKRVDKITDADLEKGMQIYKDYSERMDQEDWKNKDDIANSLASSRDHLDLYQDELSREVEKYYDYTYPLYGGARSLDYHFVEGTFQDETYHTREMTADEKLRFLCNVDCTNGAAIPRFILPDEKPTEQFKDIIKEAYDRLEARFEEYNKTVPDIEKIHTNDNMEFYTASGFRVTAMVAGDPDRLPWDNYAGYRRDGIFELYKESEVTEGHKATDHYGMDVGDHYEFADVREYFMQKPEGTDKTRYDIRKQAMDTVIFKGEDPNKITGIYVDQMDFGKATHGMLNGWMQWDYYFDKDSVQRAFSNDYMNSATTKYIRTSLETAETYDKLPDMTELREKTEERLEAEEAQKKAETGQDAQKDTEQAEEAPFEAKGEGGRNRNDAAADLVEKAVDRRSFGAHGKVDYSRNVDISDEKLAELRRDARAEAGKYGDADSVYMEKVAALTDRLEEIKGDIKYYSEKMEVEGVPHRFLSRHTGFQQAKLEYDSAIKHYVDAGGKEGDGDFVTRGVSRAEIMEDILSFRNTNYYETKWLERNCGRDFSMDQNYRDVVKDEKGDDVEVRRESYSGYANGGNGRMAVLGKIGDFLFATVFRLPLAAVDRMIDRNEVPERQRDVEKDQRKDVEKPDPGSSPVERPKDPADQPDTDHPDIDQPSVDPPETDPVDTGMDGTDEREAEAEPNDTEQTGTDQPDQEQADTDQDDTDLPDRSDADQADADQSEKEDVSPDDPMEPDPTDQADADTDRAVTEEREPLDGNETATEQKLPWDHGDQTDSGQKLPWDDEEKNESSQELPWEAETEKNQKLPWDDVETQAAQKLPWEIEAPQDGTETAQRLPWEKEAKENDTKVDAVASAMEMDDTEKPESDDPVAAESPEEVQESPDAEEEQEESVETEQEDPDDVSADAIDADVSQLEGTVSEQVDDDASGGEIIEYVKSSLGEVLNGNEEINMLLDQIDDFLYNGEFTEDDLISMAAEAIFNDIEAQGALSGSAADMAFEVINYVGYDPLEQLGILEGDLASLGADITELNQLDSTLADMFNNNDYFVTDQYGELDGLIFDDMGVSDGYTGDTEIPEFLNDNYDDLEASISNDTDTIMDAADMAYDAVEQIQSGLIDNGMDADQAMDVAMDLEDTMYQDALRDGEILADNYMDDAIDMAENYGDNMDSGVDNSMDLIEQESMNTYNDFDYEEN